MFLLLFKIRLVFSGSLFLLRQKICGWIWQCSKKKKGNFFYKGKKEEVVDRTERNKMLRFGLLMGCKVGTRWKLHHYEKNSKWERRYPQKKTESSKEEGKKKNDKKMAQLLRLKGILLVPLPLPLTLITVALEPNSLQMSRSGGNAIDIIWNIPQER